jgi:hypothetical protein
MESLPRASSPHAVGPKEKPVLSSSAIAAEHHALHSTSHRRLCSKRWALVTLDRSCAPLSHAKLAAEPLSSARNRRSTEPATSFVCWGHLPIECHLRLPMCSSATAATSTRAHRRSMNPEPASSTPSLSCRHRFPTADLLRRREPATVSPSRASSLASPSPATHRLSIGFGRWATRGWGTGDCSPVSSQVERPMWAKPVSPARPSATAGVAHCNSTQFYFPFKLFKFNSN